MENYDFKMTFLQSGIMYIAILFSQHCVELREVGSRVKER